LLILPLQIIALYLKITCDLFRLRKNFFSKTDRKWKTELNKSQVAFLIVNFVRDFPLIKNKVKWQP
jgi:hypothetical protein